MFDLRHALIACACAALIVAACVPAAHAQMPLDGGAYAFPVPDYVGSLVGANSLRPTTGDARAGTPQGSKPRHPARRPTARERATLRFAHDPDVTQRVYRRVIAQVGADVDPAVLTAQLDAAKSHFRATLARVRWSSRDLGDVAAFTFLQGYVTWREITNVPAAGLKALRRDVRDNLASQKRVRRLSDARQQEIAEILELRAIFFLDQRNDAQAAHDTAAVAATRAEMRDWIETIFGVDVNHVRITSRGLHAT